MRQLVLLLLLMVGIGVQAQIPAEVKDILKKCSEKSHSAAGTEVDMNLRVGVLGLSLNGTMKLYKKGDKSFSIVTMKGLGRDDPKKTVLRIVKDTYMLHQMETKISMATAKMTVTKIKIGVSDNMFVFDQNKFFLQSGIGTEKTILGRHPARLDNLKFSAFFPKRASVVAGWSSQSCSHGMSSLV